MKKFVVSTLLVAVAAMWMAACGGTNSNVTPPPPSCIVSSVTPSDAAGTINAGQTDAIKVAEVSTGTCAGTVNLTVPAGDGTLSASSLTANTTATVTYTAPASVGVNTSVVITATSADDSSKTGTVTITVNPTPQLPTATLTPSTTSVAAGASLNLTPVTANATNCTISAADGSASGSVSCSTPFNETPNTTTSYTLTATGPGGSITASSGTITVTGVALSGFSPRVQWVPGQGFANTITLTGINFASQMTLNCSPAVIYDSLIVSSPTQATLGVVLDGTHQGSGDRACSISQGSGTSNTAVFGIYGQNTGGILNTGELLRLNTQEVIQGENFGDNGYVDGFSASGTPEAISAKLFVGGPSCCMAVDNAPPYHLLIDATIYDRTDGPMGITLAGLDPSAVAANASGYNFGAILQPTASKNVSYFSTSGNTGSTAQVTAINVSGDPQSIAIGQVGAKVYLFILTTADGQQAIESVDMTDGATTTTSQTVTGITAGAPAGTAIAITSKGVIISFGDKAAIPFDLATLATSSAITLPGIPMSAVADLKNGIVGIGNANPTGPGGSLTVVDPVAMTAKTIVGTFPELPDSLITNPSGGFVSCPPDGTACTFLPSN